MRTNTFAVAIVVSTAACGGGTEATPSAIELLHGTMEPGCFELGPVATGTTTLEASARRQLREFQMSFDLQLTSLITSPIVDAPYASRWNVENEHVSFDGAVLARGEDWAVVKMVVVVADGRTHDAEIHALPNRTRYEIDDTTIDIAPGLVTARGYTRGCDPETGTSFEAYEDDRLVATCWPELTSPNDDGLQPSSELLCQQLVHRMLRM